MILNSNVLMPSGLTAKTPPAQEEDERIKRLRYANPEWDEYAPLWCFFLSAYEGGASFAKRENLFKHARENEEDFNDRVARIHNVNYCEPLVDFFTNFIFSESIDRNGGANQDFYVKFKADVDKRGNSIDDFMRQVHDDAQIFGMTYIIVDAPKSAPESLITKADEEQRNLSPYWVLVKPSEVIDWVVDEFDTYLYVKRRQYKDAILNGERRKLEVYTEFYPERYLISTVDVSDPTKAVFVGEEEITNSLGIVPVVVSRFKRSKEDPYMGLSFLRDFAYNNREILNQTSLLQEFLYRQAFNILAKEVDSNLPQNEQTEGEIGTANMMTVPKGANMPQYISPPVAPAQFIQDYISRIKNEMFVRAAQDALNELFNGEKSSGFSQAQSFSKTVPFISSRADMLERTESELMWLTMKMVSKEWDGKIKYKDNYAITNLSDALTQFMILVKDLQIPSETFVKEQFLRLVHEFDGKMPEDVLAKVHNEIEQFDFSAWEETQKEALVGKPAVSPGAQQKPKNTGTMSEAAAEAKVKTGATNKLKGK